MKALILAGGSGTRLRPITHTRAKQLVPVANKPILFYALESVARAGITEVGLVVGETAEEVAEAVGDGSRFGLEVTYLHQEAPLGLAHAVLVAREFLGEDDFVMYLGDNLLEADLGDFVRRFEQARARSLTPTLEESHGPGPSAQILLKQVEDPSRFGVAELDGAGRVVRLVEKPTCPPSNLALVGVYIFDAHVHEAVRRISPSARGELEITDAIGELLRAGLEVRAEVLDGWWIDTGKLTPLLEANRLVLERIERRIEGSVDQESVIDGRVVVEAGAKITRSRVRGPAVIGHDTVVTDSFVGPFTSIGSRCELSCAEVSHSVLLDDCKVIGAGRLEDSLLGHFVEVVRSSRPPVATRLVVGDHSQVALA